MRRRSFFTQNQVPDSHAPVICTTCPLRWRFAASNPDLILRALRIRILSGCVRGFSCPKTGAWIVRTRHMHYVPAPLALRGFGSGFRLVRARRLRRRIYCLASSESCASVRSLRIRILSGCVRGFFMPKNGCVGSRIPATLSSNVLSITFLP